MHIIHIGYDVLTFTYTANFTVYSHVQVRKQYEMVPYIQEGLLLVLKKRKTYEHCV